MECGKRPSIDRDHLHWERSAAPARRPWIRRESRELACFFAKPYGDEAEVGGFGPLFGSVAVEARSVRQKLGSRLASQSRGTVTKLVGSNGQA
jgi:hypothetical protein